MYAEDGFKTLITWGYRCLWLLLFISLIVCMGQFHKFMTFIFLAVAFVFLLPTIFDSKTLLEYDVHKCTLMNISEQRCSFYFI